MLYLFHTDYRGGCLMWFHRVNTLCYICFIQRWLSNVVPSSQYIFVFVFCELKCCCSTIFIILQALYHCMVAKLILYVIIKEKFAVTLIEFPIYRTVPSHTV